MNRNFSGGKRQREATRDRRRKEKEERLRRNRSLRSLGNGAAVDGEPAVEGLDQQALPEVKLEDVVISVAPQPRKQSNGPVKLFVGGLSWNTTSEDLRGAFAKFGNIEEASVVADRLTGRSRGFGFVSFTSSEHAAEAVKQMNGADLDGRTLRVNSADR
jgi:RNA recognition motif-containing protein